MRAPPRPRSLFPPLLLLLVIAASRPAPAADFAAAFLEVGIGERAIGLGQAFTAVADDASAGYWNPAGLVYVDGRVLLSHQPLSLDRQHLSISFALSIRDELGFGLTMIHAGVDDITARDATGMTLGDIDDANNAYLVSVGRAIGQRLAVGVSMKVIRQQIKAPVGSRSTLGEGKANGFDLGMRYRLGEHTVLAAVHGAMVEYVANALGEAARGDGSGAGGGADGTEGDDAGLAAVVNPTIFADSYISRDAARYLAPELPPPTQA